MNKSPHRVGIVSYNMYGNFTNYGSALQTYALHTAINSIDPDNLKSIVVDYCPDILADKNVLNPIDNMWDRDPEARERCRLSLPAIKINYDKFKNFYSTYYELSTIKYTSNNFNDSLNDENLDGYVCGSDTIFAVPEFGFDDGFYANYEVMRNRSVAYAASFGDFDIPENQIPILKDRLDNFKSIALRENDKMSTVGLLYQKALYKVIDPTLLLTPEEYEKIVENPKVSKPYLLLYSRRGNPKMDEFAEKYASEHKLEIIEISLNATNVSKHTMRYDAGVEEFLGLVQNAEMVVTNSFHGMIFAVQFRRPFYVFSRKLCDTKISEVLDLLGIEDRLVSEGQIPQSHEINYESVHQRIYQARKESLEILSKELKTLL